MIGDLGNLFISQSYNRLVQTEGGFLADGTGSTIFIESGAINGPLGLDSVTYSIYANSAETASYVSGLNFDTSSFLINSVFNNFTSSYNTGSFSGSFIGDASGLINTVSSSYSVSASFALSASWAPAGNVQVSKLYSIGFNIKTQDTYITEGSKGYRHIPSDSTIVKVRGFANTNGNINLNVRRNGSLLGNYNLKNSSASIDSTLSGWTTSLLENDLIEFYVSQSSIYITEFNFFIDLQN